MFLPLDSRASDYQLCRCMEDSKVKGAVFKKNARCVLMGQGYEKI